MLPVHHVRSKPEPMTLLRLCQINRCKGGICWEELKDTYSTVAEDMKHLQETGSVIAVKNKETNKYERRFSLVLPCALYVFLVI